MSPGNGNGLDAIRQLFRRFKGDAPAVRSLTFPNPSRSYDVLRHGVLFWGYDKTFEVSFCVDEAALSKVDPATSADEAGFLDTFDVNRDRIQAAAGRIYSQRPNASWSFAYRLNHADL